MLVYRSGGNGSLISGHLSAAPEGGKKKVMGLSTKKHSSLREPKSRTLVQEEQENVAELIQRKEHRKGGADVRESAVG